MRAVPWVDEAGRQAVRGARTHCVEDGKRPVADDADWCGEAGGEECSEPVAEGVRMQGALHRIDKEGKGGEKGDEGGDDAVEDLITRELVGQLRVEHGEADRARKVDVRLQKRDDLGTRLGCSHDEHIFGVSQDGVVKQDGKKHESEGKDLLQLGLWRQEAQGTCRSLVVAG